MPPGAVQAQFDANFLVKVKVIYFAICFRILDALETTFDKIISVDFYPPRFHLGNGAAGDVVHSIATLLLLASFVEIIHLLD